MMEYNKILYLYCKICGKDIKIEKTEKGFHWSFTYDLEDSGLAKRLICDDCLEKLKSDQKE